jgi:hypothetical protein
VARLPRSSSRSGSRLLVACAACRTGHQATSVRVMERCRLATYSQSGSQSGSQSFLQNRPKRVQKRRLHFRTVFFNTCVRLRPRRFLRPAQPDLPFVGDELVGNDRRHFDCATTGTHSSRLETSFRRITPRTTTRRRLRVSALTGRELRSAGGRCRSPATCEFR